MKRLNKSILRTSACLALALALVVSLINITPIKANAADKTVKVAYTVKQLKSAMKAKAAATIVFRTESVDPVTIPSVKKSKNKELVINAPKADIINKSKFKSITVKSVSTYTEAANGNTIIFSDVDKEGLVIAKGKTVNKVTFTNWLGYDPSYIVRKGAKIKSVAFESLDKNVSKSNTEKRTVTIEGQASEYELSDYYKATFKLDKSGRISKSNTDSAYKGNIVITYKYDKNGNHVTTTTTEPGDIVKTTTREYNSDNLLVKISSAGNSGEDSYVTYEYNSDGKLTEYAVKYADGNDMYVYTCTYDKKGRLSETYLNPYDITEKLTYDTAGRCIEEVHDQRGEVTTIGYEYDKNGLVLKRTEEHTAGYTFVQEYTYDFLGNNIYTVYKTVDVHGYSDNESRYGYIVGEYSGESPRYEDGFVSPVNNDGFDKAALEKAGYTVVTETKELIDAIAPNAKIIIAPGSYNMSHYIEMLDPEAFNRGHKYVQLNKGWDGYELVVKDADGLMISGGTAVATETELVIEPRYSAIFRFENCDDLVLNSFTCGHTEKSQCEGNVIDLYNCKNVSFYGMDMFGCGVFGIGGFDGSGKINVFNSVIHDCENGIAWFEDLADTVTFTNCLFYGSGGGVINHPFDNDKLITFKKCSFDEWETNNLTFDDYIYEDCLWSEITSYPDYMY